VNRAIFRHLLPARTAMLVVMYGVLFVIGLFAAYQVRFDFVLPPIYRSLLLENLTWMVPLKLVLLFAFGQFGGLLSYFRLPDLYRVVGAMGTAALAFVYIWYVTDGRDCPPRSVILGDFMFSVAGIASFRIALRVARERFFSGAAGGRKVEEKRLAIVGAGDAGAQIAADLLARPGLGMRPVVFLDDDSSKWKKQLHGITVVDSPDQMAAVKQTFGIDRIIIAMPSASPKRLREIIAAATEAGVPAEIVPSLAELSSGQVRAERVRPVQIEDLLGREPVQIDQENIRELLRDGVVMVTGAGGSIGCELSRQISRHAPQRLLLLDQSEVQLFQIEQMLLEEGWGSTIVPLIADVADEVRMREILERYRPQLIFHAAAHKHVYLMERQPGEAIKNNTLATANLARLAAEFKVHRFVLISTDKAVNPTSVMGASKRLAEHCLQALQREPGITTSFLAVRFGNVLGSSGSVIPIFRRQIAQGGPVKVTHPEVTRYFMTVTEAAGLVLQCSVQGEGGEILVLDMGEPVRIIDLARQMIELSGFRPEIDIDIEYVGLRPGEKLYEELQHTAESHEPTGHPRIYRLKTATCRPWSEWQAGLNALYAQLPRLERTAVRHRIRDLVPDYTPFEE